MSDESKLPDIIIEDDKPKTDLTPADLVRVERYKESGLPGISDIQPEVITRMADLYLSGKTYQQISNICRVKKDAVMYLADRGNWYKEKKAYLVELDQTMKTRIVEAKLMSQDFTMQLQQFFEKKIGKNIRRYLATDSDDIANEVSLKDVGTYIKILEALTKSLGESKPKAPAVGVYLSEGATVTKRDDNSIEITPKEKAVGQILKEFADSRRKEEKK